MNQVFKDRIISALQNNIKCCDCVYDGGGSCALCEEAEALIKELKDDSCIMKSDANYKKQQEDYYNCLEKLNIKNLNSYIKTPDSYIKKPDTNTKNHFNQLIKKYFQELDELKDQIQQLIKWS